MAAGNDHDQGRKAHESERRSRAAFPSEPASSRDVANEDFLFHLYRGSELLQDNRVLEAKSELEHALMLQPRDPKGQDLMALVYFRIGHYPRAIQIYEELLRETPNDPALRLNLALCHLKTGQAYSARLELEQVVQAHPGHKRAWGYLGLAYERQGDLEKARYAFERGGHEAMARRVSSLSPATSRAPTERPRIAAGGAEQVRAAAAVAFAELDAGELSFALAEPATGQQGIWHAVEPGAGVAVLSEVPPPPPSESVATAPGPPARRPRYDTLDWAVRKEGEPASPGSTAPRSVTKLLQEARLDFAQGETVSLLRNGLALVRVDPERDFAARLEAVRSMAGELTTAVLPRHLRGQSTQETLGGVATPIVRVGGEGEILLGPLPAHRILGFRLREEVAFVREDLLLGFDARTTYENGRLAVGESDSLPMVQLRGPAVVLLELRDPIASFEASAARSVTVRREVLIGWIGRLVPRALTIAEAPCGQRGLVTLAGDGTVLVAAR